MMNVGFWGKKKGRLHRFFLWSQVSIPMDAPLNLKVGDGTCTETHMAGHVRVTPEEAAFLSGIGCKVLYFGRGPKPDQWDDALEYHQAARYAIQGDGSRVTGLEADGSLYAVEGVFLLRDSVVADSLLPGLEMQDGHIGVDAAMATSVPGVFAAGDCVGKPYQVAKAAGEGNIAALSADRWLTASTEGAQ